MKVRRMYAILLVGAVLLPVIFLFGRSITIARMKQFFIHKDTAEILNSEKQVYPNPELLDLTGNPNQSHLDENSTSTAHATSKSTVAGGQASATSSPTAVRVPIMIYHSVRPHVLESALQDGYDITPELLEREILYLKSHAFSIVKFADLDGALNGVKSLPANPVILSFDDGWENQYQYAFPVLKKHNVSGTFYIYTNPVGRSKHWMTWTQIKELDKAGMEIGGHSRTHPYLNKIIDPKLLDKEITQPKVIIETRLGHPIDSFAYPFGFYNARVVAAVKRAGYKNARNVFSGVWQDAQHRYELRGALSTDNFKDFERYVTAK